MRITDLTVYRSPLPKIRLWKDGDGGYIICDGLEYDCFLSWGIQDDISFEEDFLEKYPHVWCHAFDGSIHQLPPMQKSTSEWRLFFHQKYIGWEEAENVSNLHTFFEENNDIMIKMDIEGGEFAWIHSLTDSHLDKIQQMVIEFHTPFTKKKWDILSRLTHTHWLVHFHPNNCIALKNNFVQGVYVPDVFECTYIRKKSILVNPLPYSTERIPGPLDQKNTLRQDIVISGFPYNSRLSIGFFVITSLVFVRAKLRLVCIKLHNIFLWRK